MSVALCVLRIEVDEELEDMADKPGTVASSKGKQVAKWQKKKDRGARETKTIVVETYATKLAGSKKDWALLPTSSRETTPKQESLSRSNSQSSSDEISFFYGNPLIEVTKGVLHLYKENELKEAGEANGAHMLCLLAVPAALGAKDLLAFAAACQEEIAHVRVLRDGSPAHYMALLTFRSPAAAREFHAAFDGVAYSSLEPGALCHAAWVSRVEWTRDGAPPPSHTELPTCPVCLERMEESVAGVLSVQCAHAFHADCLLRWGDASCPVCRCAQTPEPTAHAECFECVSLREELEVSGEFKDLDKLEDVKEPTGVVEGLLDGVEAGALWICLICGHVGCGRYEGGHAAKHFLSSNHTYALQLGSNRVWDYAGDNFVHRLVQNKGDGKLVAAEGGGVAAGDGAACVPDSDKLDSAQLEFMHLLTQQLERQRLFYEEKISRIEESTSKQVEELQAKVNTVIAENEKLKTVTSYNKNLEKKVQLLTGKITMLQSELAEERGLAKAMASSQSEWQAQAKVKEETHTKEVTDLKEQLRDVMFFVEARDQLEHNKDVSSEELAGASVEVNPTHAKKGRRKKLLG